MTRHESTRTLSSATHATSSDEAADAASQSVGTSTYLAGIGYSVEEFKRELKAATEYIRSQTRIKRPRAA